MENETIRTKIRQARECVQELEEPFQRIAFQVILEALIKEEGLKKSGKATSEPTMKTFPPINEFFSTAHPKAFTEAVVTIAYYLHHAEKVSYFTIQDIAEGLSKCRAGKPKNLSDVLAGCARNGWLAEGNEKQAGMKSWYLTASGEKYMEMKLNKMQ